MKLINIFLTLIVISVLFILNVCQVDSHNFNEHCNNNKPITVSGISSGGFMAVQFHIAFSSMVKGAGIIAGGPFYCAKGSATIAVESCMINSSLISLPELFNLTHQYERQYAIDSTINLARSKVWLFSGLYDTLVSPGSVHKLESYYSHYIPASRIKAVYNIPAEHSFVTKTYGNDCLYNGSPYINHCGYDTAYNLLSHLYGGLLSPSSSPSLPSNIIQINQTSFLPTGINSYDASIYEYGYAYIPQSCSGPLKNTGECSLHIVFHGCPQSVVNINSTFYMNTGYNQVADTNNLIILYPQAQSNALNPLACWDWWGYTSPDYSTQYSVQMITIKKMASFIQTEYISTF